MPGRGPLAFAPKSCACTVAPWAVWSTTGSGRTRSDQGKSESPLPSARPLRRLLGLGRLFDPLAVDRLLAPKGLATIRDWCTRVGGGQEWHQAFAAAFGETTDAFYARFEAFRAEYVR